MPDKENKQLYDKPSKNPTKQLRIKSWSIDKQIVSVTAPTITKIQPMQPAFFIVNLSANLPLRWPPRTFPRPKNIKAIAT